MARSLVTIDLGAIRHNAGVLADRVAPAELWAVVKADGYGHGAADAGAGGARRAARPRSASRRWPRALALRAALPDARILVLGPTADEDVAHARAGSLELTAVDERVPEGVPVHLKLDTGMGRWGLGELPSPGRSVVGLMTHLATSDSDQDFARVQLDRFLERDGAVR